MMHPPLMVSWNITRECNLSCLHCYRDAGRKDDGELTDEEGLRLIDEIARCGFRLLILSGGEPLMRRDLPELIRHASGLGVRTVTGTNGTLITEERAQALRDAGLSRCGISIDSSDREQHDAFRQKQGAFDQALAGIEACRKAGLPFQVHTTVREKNCAEIEKITDFALSLGAVAHHIFFLVPVGRALSMEEEQLKAGEHERLLRRILKKQQSTSIEIKPTCAPTFMRIARQMDMDLRFTRGCLAALSYCVILPNGDVHPCPYLPVNAGNVRKHSFADIWSRSPELNELRQPPKGKKCGSCEYTVICGGCRARAYHASGGDFLQDDPGCLHQPGGKDRGTDKS
jgi:AdoMet-dependent heme synthase